MATFFVRQSGGSDLNDGLSFANAFATLQQLVDTVTAGDLGLVASDGVYAPTSAVDVDTNAGVSGSPVKIRGASPTGVDDGSIATVNGSGISPANATFDSGMANLNHIEFEGIRFTAGANRNFLIDGDNRGWIFRRCRFDNAVSNGFTVLSDVDAQLSFVDCEFDNNGLNGFGVESATRGRITFVNCLVHDNTANGISNPIAGFIWNCWVYKNGANGLLLDNSAALYYICNNVIDENAADGLTLQPFDVAVFLCVCNNIFSNNGGWGFTFDGEGTEGLRGHNLYFNNTLGEVSYDGIVEDTLEDFETLGGSLIGDPLYTNTADGLEDYRTSASGPGFQAGYPDTLMGSTSRAAANFAHIGSEVPSGGSGGHIIGGHL